MIKLNYVGLMSSKVKAPNLDISFCYNNFSFKVNKDAFVQI